MSSKQNKKKKRQRKKPLPLWMPQFWPSWAGLFILYSLSFLPFRMQLPIGRLIGLLLYYLASSRRHICEVNIQLCFPQKSAKEQQALVRQCFIENGIGVMETGFSWWQDVHKLKEFCEIEGIEHFDRAMEQGNGVILLGAHFATLDISGPLLMMFRQSDVLYRTQTNPVFNRSMLKGRKRWIENVIERSDTRSALRSLKKGHAIWYAADQDYGRKVSVFAPFFGIEAASITATSRFAQLNNSPVLMYSCHRKTKEFGYIMKLGPILENYPSGDDRQDAIMVNKVIENAIREAPAQYLWVHRRFKTRPEGEEKLY